VEVERRGVEGRMEESGAVDEANRLGEANKKSWTLESVTSGARVEAETSSPSEGDERSRRGKVRY
jgi:hypothetical protein